MQLILPILSSLLLPGLWACSTDIQDVASFRSLMSDMDVIIDVRNWNEYTGNGDASCNSGSDPNKCNYGHHSSMYFLENPYRDDKAAVYKVDGVNTVESALVTALANCYGNAVATTKIMTSCHSGSRSGAFQQKLVDAGFACENVYNFVPGARGLHEANEVMHTSASDPGPFDWTSCPADTSGPGESNPTNGATGFVANGGLVLAMFAVALAL
mmetsp:Transcript_14088/g.29532  ORF Transcript_14088/g.29532 Transcript_14088/m.29532 type:complete len:213 (-) Transcript_14088:131-769(-)